MQSATIKEIDFVVKDFFGFLVMIAPVKVNVIRSLTLGSSLAWCDPATNA